MRLRKIHAIVAVSLALVLVARSVDARRRNREEFAPNPIGEVPDDPQVGVVTDEPIADEARPTIESVTLVADVVVAEPAAPDDQGAEPDVSGGRRWLPRGPIAITATVVVLMAVLAGAIVAAALGGVID